jgi:hypothetical protein
MQISRRDDSTGNVVPISAARSKRARWADANGRTVELVSLSNVSERPHSVVRGYVPAPNHDGDWFAVREPASLHSFLVGYYDSVEALSAVVDMSTLTEI